MSEVIVVITEDDLNGREVAVFDYIQSNQAAEWFKKLPKASMHRVEVGDSKPMIMFMKNLEESE